MIDKRHTIIIILIIKDTYRNIVMNIMSNIQKYMWNLPVKCAYETVWFL